MESIQQLLASAPLFALVLSRVAGLVLVAPVLGAADIPLRIKAAFSVFCAVVLFPAARASFGGPPPTIHACLLMIVAELLVGMAIGFGARLALMSFQVAGEIMGYQIGLAVAQEATADPDLELTIPSLLLYLVALAGFLVLDVHHLMIRALAASYGSLGEGMARLTAPFIRGVVLLFSATFADGVMAAAPCLAVMMVMTFAVALMAKAIPRIPILLVGYPMRVVVGIFVLVATAGVVWPVAVRGFARLADYLAALSHTL